MNKAKCYRRTWACMQEGAGWAMCCTSLLTVCKIFMFYDFFSLFLKVKVFIVTCTAENNILWCFFK